MRLSVAFSVAALLVLPSVHGQGTEKETRGFGQFGGMSAMEDDAIGRSGRVFGYEVKNKRGRMTRYVAILVENLEAEDNLPFAEKFGFLSLKDVENTLKLLKRAEDVYPKIHGNVTKTYEYVSEGRAQFTIDAMADIAVTVKLTVGGSGGRSICFTGPGTKAFRACLVEGRKWLAAKR